MAPKSKRGCNSFQLTKNKLDQKQNRLILLPHRLRTDVEAILTVLTRVTYSRNIIGNTFCPIIFPIIFPPTARKLLSLLAESLLWVTTRSDFWWPSTVIEQPQFRPMHGCIPVPVGPSTQQDASSSRPTYIGANADEQAGIHVCKCINDRLHYTYGTIV